MSALRRRRLTLALTALAFTASPAAPAGAASVTSDGQTLRYRSGFGQDDFFDLDVASERGRPTAFAAVALGPLDTGPGCELFPNESFAPGYTEVRCVIRTGVRRRALRSRFVFRDGDDLYFDFGDRAVGRSVVYSGRGDDGVIGADLAYGGPGSDELNGITVHGGAGNDEVDGIKVSGGAGDDELDSEERRGIQTVLRGGPGADKVEGLGWLYGGSGDDVIRVGAFPSAVDPPSMAVGGRGRDRVVLDRGRRVVVRVRGGGADSVTCPDPATRSVVLFVDRSDRIDPTCNSARITFTGRPRRP